MVEGYKKTEIGLYPNDWIEDTLENVITVLTDFTANGSFASLAQNVKYLDKPNYARLIRLTDIRADFKNDAVYISKDAYSFLSKSKLYGNELLLANVGAYAGYSFLYQDGLPFKGSLGPNMFLIKFKEKLFVSKYAYYSFTFDVILQQLLSKAASSAQPKLNKQNVRECLVCYPPTKAEQTAIATALNDADALITQIEKLIDKKKAIKQGAVQELFKPKKGWKTKMLGDITNIRRGASPRPIKDPKWFSQKGRGWIRISDVTSSNVYLNSTTQYLSDEGVRYSVPVDMGDLIMSICATIGVPVIVNIPACIHDGFVLFSNYENNLDTFYLYFFLQKETDVLVGKGQPGTQKNLNISIVGNIEISYPSVEQQNKIGLILKDIDIELSGLEQKLEKHKQLKQGMMQSLLTGKIRLV